MDVDVEEDVDEILKNFQFNDSDFIGDEDSDNDSQPQLKKKKSDHEESDHEEYDHEESANEESDHEESDHEESANEESDHEESDHEESDHEDESIKFDLTLKSKGAIGIFTHGKLIYNQMVRVPANVSIQKQDFSGRGCFAITPNRGRNDPELFDLTKKAIEDVKGCVDENEYRIQLEEWVKNHPEDKNGVTLDSICPFYKKKIYEDKKYTIGKTSENIFFIIHVPASPRPIYIHVNLMECDQATLEFFFNTLGKLREEDKTIITEFITKRDNKMEKACIQKYTEVYENEKDKNHYNERNYKHWCKTLSIPQNMGYYYYLREITITQLFKLIELSAKCLNVDNVNILDKSCNVLIRSEDATRSSSKRYTTIDGYNRPRFYDGFPFSDDSRFTTNKRKRGGKRTRKNIKHKRRKTRGKPRNKHLSKHR